jgi:beta-glucanase (GH16 family)
MNVFSRMTIFMLAAAIGCTDSADDSRKTPPAPADGTQVVVEAESYVSSSDPFERKDGDPGNVEMTKPGWLAFDVEFPTAGRYRVQVYAQADADAAGWVEDYIENADGRTYNVTGTIPIPAGNEFADSQKEGSPFNTGIHRMKFHLSEGAASVDKIVFTLMKAHQQTPESRTQKMDGTEWKLVWSDEFDGAGVDDEKWTYDIGNWGWGNNELQYYTEKSTDNARTEDGNLVIEARKNDQGNPWTSARLTTRGKVSFLYGKIELRAKVPREKGCWAAGWTLGDKYVDEMSWPYCGEIDILESVGFEVNDETGDGQAHATCHTPAYYFKINNQITSTKDVANMAGEFHTYSVVWTPTEIRAYVDDEEYYVYDKNANEKEWPFDKPQNIILNLAMGGGWGGAQGMDETVTSQKFIIDYVRVYEKQ